MYGASTYYAKITTVRVHYEPFYQDHLVDDVPRRLATVLSDGNTSLNTSTFTYNYSQFNVSFCENFFDSYGINLTSLLSTLNVSSLSREQLSCFRKEDIAASPIPGFYDPAFMFLTLFFMFLIYQSIFIVKQMRYRRLHRVMRFLMNVHSFKQLHRIKLIKSCMRQHEKLSYNDNAEIVKSMKKANFTKSTLQRFGWQQLKDGNNNNNDDDDGDDDYNNILSYKEYVVSSYKKLFKVICDHVIDPLTLNLIVHKKNESIRQFLERVKRSLPREDPLISMLDKYIDDYEASRYSPNLLNSQEQYEFRKNYNFLLSMFVSTTSPTLMHRMGSGSNDSKDGI